MSIHSTLQPFLTAASVQPEFLLPADHAFLKTLSRHFLGPSSNLNDGNAKQKTRGLTEAHPSIMYRKITSYLPHKYIQAFIGNIHPTKPFLRIFWGEKVFQTQSKRLLQVVCNNTLCVWGGFCVGHKTRPHPSTSTHQTQLPIALAGFWHTPCQSYCVGGKKKPDSCNYLCSKLHKSVKNTQAG